jgi:sigma-B regulation protein RsbU (phosphoserine phosphatase)
MRILLVDDCEDSCELNEAALVSAGYQDVRAVKSAWEAFKALDIGRVPRESPPLADIILLDIVMPEVDGIEACARIRNDPRYADTPILMVTSLDDVENLNSAFAAGATDYIAKPVNRVELLARVRAAHKLKSELERRQARERELLTFVSSWGDRRASLWVDEATGLFVGEVAEAYLMATPEIPIEDTVSIIAITIDRLEDYRSAQGEAATRSLLANVAHAVRSTAATIGVMAAAYRNGMIVLVVPETTATAARKLGETLCSTISHLAIVNAGSSAAGHVTASVSVVTGRVRRGADRAHLLTHAISTVKAAAENGGNRVAAAQV